MYVGRYVRIYWCECLASTRARVARRHHASRTFGPSISIDFALGLVIPFFSFLFQYLKRLSPRSSTFLYSFVRLERSLDATYHDIKYALSRSNPLTRIAPDVSYLFFSLLISRIWRPDWRSVGWTGGKLYTDYQVSLIIVFFMPKKFFACLLLLLFLVFFFVLFIFFFFSSLPVLIDPS